MSFFFVFKWISFLSSLADISVDRRKFIEVISSAEAETSLLFSVNTVQGEATTKPTSRWPLSPLQRNPPIVFFELISSIWKFLINDDTRSFILLIRRMNRLSCSRKSRLNRLVRWSTNVKTRRNRQTDVSEEEEEEEEMQSSRKKRGWWNTRKKERKEKRFFFLLLFFRKRKYHRH